MPHTPMMRTARRALGAARAGLGLPPRTRSALSRRQAMVLLAAAGASACAPQQAGALDAPVVIVGGGTAGLTAALRLAEAGRACAIHEAGNRFGGRMFTRRNFTPEGQFCELGGELVDSNHTQLQALAKELGVGIERLTPEDQPAIDFLYFGGKVYTARDILDPASGGGAFAPVAKRIAEDQEALYDASGNWTARARELDLMSLEDYLDQLRPIAPAWVIDFLGIAYLGELGLPLDQQSALNMVDFIDTDVASEFSVFGESDEAFRIAGGSSSLPEAIEAKLAGEYAALVSLNKGRELTAIADEAGKLVLTFAGAGAGTVTAAHVILALPFTRLRTVTGIDRLGLSAGKLAAIREFGYGQNAKIMTPTNGRPLAKSGIRGENRPVGSIYTDGGFQLAWDTSRGQAGEHGILTNFFAGPPALGDQAGAQATLAAGLASLDPKVAASLRESDATSFFWARHPQTLGSYSCPRPGQYTTLAAETAAPELNGRLHFAGEHTSSVSMGFMNGAVESGERAAGEVLGAA
jgi:monoamine oxidase